MRTNRWKNVQLKTLCNKIGDGLHGTPNYSDNSDIFFINGNNLVNGKILISKNTMKVPEFEWKDNFIELNKNSLLLSINGTIGELAFYNDEKVMLGKSIAYLNFKTEINIFYYYYFQLKNIQKYFYQIATGSTIKNLGLKSLQDFEVPYPNKESWKPITRILSELDKKIETNNKIIEKLDAIANLIYDYWFVQFDFPDKNGKPYKSSGGKMFYNEDLKKEVPFTWSVRNISEIMEICSGYPFKSSTYLDSGTYKIVTIKNVQDNRLKLDNTAFINSLPSEINSSSILSLQDILISLTGNVGRICLVDEQNLLLNQRVGKFQTDPILKNYFYLTYRKSEFRSWLERISNGTSQKNLSPIEAVNRLHAIPDSSILIQFDKLVDPMIKKILSKLDENKRLENLRDWLLPMLMNGHVTVI